MRIIQLNEMAYERPDAIRLCSELGTEFIEHFHKAVKEGIKSNNFTHHCSEMEAWWERVKWVVLKYNKKQISAAQLKDWFFEAGSSVEFVIEEPYQDVYNKLILNLLLDYNKSVQDVLVELL